MVYKVPSIYNKKSQKDITCSSKSMSYKLCHKGSSDCNIGNLVTTKQKTKRVNRSTSQKCGIVDNSCFVSSKGQVANAPIENQLDGMHFLRSLNRRSISEQKLCTSTPHHQDDVSYIVSPKKVTRSMKKVSEDVVVASTPKINQSIIKFQNGNTKNKTIVKQILDTPYSKEMTNYQPGENFNIDYLNIILTPSSEVMSKKSKQHSLQPNQVASITPLKCIKESSKKPRRPPKKNKQMQMQCRSFEGCVSMDELSVKKHIKRKAKSENFKVQLKASSGRKRAILNELNKANADCKDIYKFHKIDPLKDLENMHHSTPHYQVDVSYPLTKRVTRSMKKTSEAVVASTSKIKQCMVKLQNCNTSNKTAVKQILDKPYSKGKTNYPSEVNLDISYLNITSTPSCEVLFKKSRQHSLQSKQFTSVSPLKSIKKTPKKNKQTQMQCRSFGNYVSVDELSVRKNVKCKAKSENFKLQLKDSSRRKRAILGELNKASAGCEDDIYKFQKLDLMKDLEIMHHSTPHHQDDVSYPVSPKRVTRSMKKTSEAVVVASTPKLKQCTVKRQNCNTRNKTDVKQILDKSYSKRKTNYPSEVNLDISYINITSTPSCEVLFKKSRQHSLKSKQVTSVTSLKSIKELPKKKNQTRMQCRSFAACASVDDLCRIKHIKRKAKSENFNVQHKSTLKRKKYVLNELNKADAGHEDDIYEFQKFDHFKDLLEDTMSISDVSLSIETPKLGCHATPMAQRCHTPVFKDCISPTEYANVRKIALEVQHRKKRYTSKSVEAEIEKCAVASEKKKLEFDKILKNLQEHQKAIKKITDQDGDSIDEENYFSDC